MGKKAVNNCCLAPASIGGKKGGTRYWLCDSCKEPCDVAMPFERWGIFDPRCEQLVSAPHDEFPAIFSDERSANAYLNEKRNWFSDGTKVVRIQISVAA